MPSSKGHQPLSVLINRALRKFGDGAGSYLQAGDTDLFLMYANDVIREYNIHPYNDDQDDLEYYDHEQEKRDIDDLVMVKGLTFFYALDQGSKRLQFYQQDYYQTLNSWLHNLRSGSGPITLQVVDREDTSEWPPKEL